MLNDWSACLLYMKGAKNAYAIRTNNFRREDSYAGGS